ncbi:hypothetical protein M2347_002122 [Chryseobacterium sp. H1D6B]|uniref:hypothetical protein n=1 Tax=Chryseobacterium sp. H1D6B TaxID=2940588 RepID=UPI0015CDFC86|nr:hypothetical protein [Chryseobacterium sp. H1D6B]MDH6252395.1 hypothetical protein [Chryseobacterium sp. H1D6B]
MSEMSDFKKNHIKQLEEEEKKVLQDSEKLIMDFIRFAENKDIELTEQDFKYTQKSGIVVESTDIFLRLNDDIVPDKDGLFDYKLLNSKFKKQMFSDGYFFADNYIAMASPLFRRNYSSLNGFQPRFIEKFWALAPSDYDEIKISLNQHHLKIDTKDSAQLELDTWYGSVFDQNVENISDQLVKLRPSPEFDDSEISFFFADTYSVDIKWALSKTIKTFQAEEFKSENIKVKIDGIVYFPVRYVHAEFDMNTLNFRHFDGAFHFYTEEEYFRRRDSDLNYNRKDHSQIKSRSKKLFKINGEISTEKWVDLTSHFFSRNPLVYEYFNGSYPPNIKEILDLKRKNQTY